VIGRILGHYTITAAIGAGGMGAVYRATDRTLGRDVAIKVLPPEVAQDVDRLARFEREAKLLGSLNHPHVAHVYGFEAAALDGEAPVHFLAMELVEGDDLAQRLAHGPIPVDDTLAVARQIAEALEAAHERGIVHRDLKPANVKVRDDGTVKVLDFGLAKASSPGKTAPADVSQSPTIVHPGTAVGMILGTAAYMSPEQARGRLVDKRADIWAFGVLLWEMLTGKQLFAGQTVSDILAAVLTRDPDWTRLPPQLPPPVLDVLRRCLVRDPKQRLHDIADARILLDEAISGVSTVVPVAIVRADKQDRTKQVLAGLVLVLAIVAGSLGWIVARGTPLAPSESRTLSLVLPPNLRWAEESFASIGISPDGRTVAVVAEDDINRRLYLRSLNSPELRTVEGTEGAEGPFFSPDGRWIAFSQNGLKKLSLDGGAPVSIAPRIFGKGAWSPAGDIYYTSDYHTGLFRVSAAGGTPQELTKSDAAQGELNHGYPELLPGGRTLLFTSVRSPLSASRVEALRLDTGARHVVIEHAIEARYLQPGYLAFVRDQTLMVAPFDLGTLRLTGPAQPARHRVAVYFGVAHAEYALSGNGTLVLVPSNVLPPRREVVRLDRAGRTEIILPAESSYKGPALSPDRHQLALTRNDNGFDVVVYDLQRKSITRLAASARREYSAVWDRSGTRIFHVVDLPLFQIFETETSGGGEPKRVLEGSQDQVPQDVSPDGQWLLFLQTTAVNRWSVGILPLARPQEARLFGGEEGAASFATFSPDGRFIAFQSDATGREEVYVRPVAGNARPVPVSGGGGQLPRWARNGELFFWQRDLLSAVQIRTSPTLQIGPSRPLYRTVRERPAYYDGDYDVSADGQSIYLTRTPDLLRPRELRVVTDWGSEVEAIVARGGGN
jgi:eukaryotic-like serine/threonine-protein kinase